MKSPYLSQVLEKFDEHFPVNRESPSGYTEEQAFNEVKAFLKESLEGQIDWILEKMEEMIKSEGKHKNEKGVCMLCAEDEFCFHDCRIGAITQITELLTSIKI